MKRNQNTLSCWSYQHEQGVFVVVDAVSTGSNLPAYIRGKGRAVVHVRSKKLQNIGLPYHQGDFIADYAENDSLFKLFEKLKNHTIFAVIPGADTGTVLADEIDHYFNLPTANDYSKRRARRSKYLMQETLREAGIATVHQKAASRLGQLELWQQDHPLPLVLKPEESTGTDHVYICRTIDELREGFNAIINARNIYYEKNSQVIAQEYLVGEEYIVSTVSYNSETFISSMMKVNKKVADGSPLYDFSIVINPDEEHYQNIAEFVKSILPVLGFNFGATDTEIILTENGPRLIEVNPRLTGAYDISLIDSMYGYSQVSVLVDAYLNPESLIRRIEVPFKPYKRFGRSAFFIVRQGGKVRSDPELSMMNKIPGFTSARFKLKKGDNLPVTKNLMNSVGMINLVSNIEEQVEEGIRHFREVEGRFYEQVLKPSLFDSNINQQILFAAFIVAILASVCAWFTNDKSLLKIEAAPPVT